MKARKPQPGDALIVVDVQKDFLPGGTMAVPAGNEVLTPLNDYLRMFHEAGLPIIATRDWHPPDHISFQDRGGRWPPHCVQHTSGAEFAPDLALPEATRVISKGTRRDREAYSGLQDTGLAEQLRELGVRRVFIGGLATDYCVLDTVLDARSAGFDVVLLEDAVRGIDAHPGDSAEALETMRSAGANATSRAQLHA